jgi:hypothetical protein
LASKQSKVEQSAIYGILKHFEFLIFKSFLDFFSKARKEGKESKV